MEPLLRANAGDSENDAPRTIGFHTYQICEDNHDFALAYTRRDRRGGSSTGTADYFRPYHGRSMRAVAVGKSETGRHLRWVTVMLVNPFHQECTTTAG